MAKDYIGFAHRIASELWDAGYRDAEGATVLSMALAIYASSHDPMPSNIGILVDGMIAAAEIAYAGFIETDGSA